MLIGFRPCANVTQPGDDGRHRQTDRAESEEEEDVPRGGSIYPEDDLSHIW